MDSMIYDINIFRHQAIEDLDALENILLSAYSGKEYWELRGIRR